MLKTVAKFSGLSEKITEFRRVILESLLVQLASNLFILLYRGYIPVRFTFQIGAIAVHIYGVTAVRQQLWRIFSQKHGWQAIHQ
jgi:hypothetical protein